MKTLQEILDLAILNYYGSNKSDECRTEYMCVALHRLDHNKLITEQELHAAEVSINRYMNFLLKLSKPYLNDTLTLSSFKDTISISLSDSSPLPFLSFFKTLPLRTHIYKNWNKRPKTLKALNCLFEEIREKTFTNTLTHES